MNAETYMAAAIENAKAREAQIYATEKRIFAGHTWGKTETPHGLIAVSFIVAKGRLTLRPEHMRQCWELNGKRIAKSDLIIELNKKKAAA